MRVYWSLNREQLTALAGGVDLVLTGQPATAVTAGFADTVSTQDDDELDLLAALSSLDVNDNCGVIAALDVEAEVTDDALGEVIFSAEVSVTDIGCFMIADVDAQELSWYGIQEIDDVVTMIGTK